MQPSLIYEVLRWDGTLIARNVTRKVDANKIAKDSAKKYGQSYIYLRRDGKLVGAYHILYNKGSRQMMVVPHGDVTSDKENPSTRFVAYAGDNLISVGNDLDKAFAKAKMLSKQFGESALYDSSINRMIAHFVNGVRTQEGVQTRASRSVTYKPKGPMLSNPRRVLIYAQVNRIIATKKQKHICDAECKRHGHRYFHDFTSSPKMYGLPNGDLLITTR